jgi:ankyrin repeat protein
MPSEIEQKLNYDAIPLSKRLQMTGTSMMTKNSVQTEMNWGPEINRIDPGTGYTPLMVAAANGNPASVSTLMDRGADGDYREPKKGYTALIVAAKKGNTDAADMLLKRGVSISNADKNGMQPLMWAAKNGHLDVVKVLIDRGVGINAFDPNNWTALHYAAKYGHKAIVELLANAGASIILKESLEEGKTPLMLAAQYGRRETVILLVQKGSDVNTITTRDELTALILAAKEGHKGTVRALLERGADANLSDSYGWTPLHFCSSWGRKETAKLLIREGGANVNSMPVKKKSGAGGTTPLIIACKGQQTGMIDMLLTHGANASVNDAASGKNPLAIAAQEGFTKSVEALISHNVDLNVRDSRRMTPLMLAVVGGHAETIRTLLAACADITLLDVENKSALEHARDFDREDTYLMAILKSSALGKANIIPWLEMDTPKMLRGSVCGGPSVFLNNILYGKDGLFAGLFLRGPEQDVHLLHNLIMVIAAAGQSRRAQPLDAVDLEKKLVELDEMLMSIFDSRSFSIDHNVSLALLLQSFPESIRKDGQYNYRYFASAFATGPLALYLENDRSKMLTAYQMGRVIDNVFTCCLKADLNAELPGNMLNEGGGTGSRHYGERTGAMRMRYIPAAMFFMEGVSKLLLLVLVILNIQTTKGQDTFAASLGGTMLQQILALWVVSSCLVEAGLMEEKAWSVSPSIAVDPLELSRRRRANVWGHFFRDVWKSADTMSLAPLLAWVVMALGLGMDTGVSSIAHAVMCVSAIPLCFGLMRYPAGFNRQFGTIVLSIYLIMKSLWPFAVVFAVTGAGFGIALSGMFYDVAGDFFINPSETFRTLFDAMNHQYSLAIFDDARLQPGVMGVVLTTIFIAWTVIVLINTVVAHVAAMYSHTSQEAGQMWLFLKSRDIQQHMLVYEKSPMAMLPAPLNLITVAVLPMHQIYIWRARLYMDRGVDKCISVAGSLADWVLKVVFIIPICAIEFAAFFMDGSVRLEERWSAVILLPFEIVGLIFSVISKMLLTDNWTMSVMVKSRLAKGRLRLSYGDSRDLMECIGVDDNNSVIVKKEWVDDGGGGRNPGKYAQINPEEGSQPGGMDQESKLGDQEYIWSNAMGGLVKANELSEADKAKGLGLTNTFGEQASQASMNKMGKMAFAGSVASSVKDDKGSVRADGVDMGVGKGDFYDHKFGNNVGPTTGNNNTWEATQQGAMAGGPLSIGASNALGDDFSVSVMSDLSSAELLQRYPAPPAANNEFVKELYNGLFDHLERRAVFEVVLADMHFLEQVRHDMMTKVDKRPGDEDDEDEEFHPEQLYNMYEALQEQLMSQNNKRDKQMSEIIAMLAGIRSKTDTIRDKKTRPADFDLVPLDQHSQSLVLSQIEIESEE